MLQLDSAGGGLVPPATFTCPNGIPDFAYRRHPHEADPARPQAHHEPKPHNMWCSGSDWHPLPFTGLAYHVKRGGLLEFANGQFHMERLAGIRQFDWKSRLHEPAGRYDRFRYGHSFDTAAVANLICDRNAATLDARTRKTTVLVSLLHDILTPAGGDTVKGIAAALDEDHDFAAFIESDAYWEACCLHDLEWKGSVPIANEESAAGVIKSLADKIAYVSRDAGCILHACAGRPDETIGELAAVRAIVRRRPDVCGVWEDIRIQDGVVVLAEPERLRDFLLLRALLWKLMYQNPETRTPDLVLNYSILEHLFRTGRLTVAELRSMRDEDLDRQIIHKLVTNFGALECRRECFTSWDAALARRAELVRGGVYFSFLEDFRRLPGYSTNYLVPSPVGARPFRLIHPDLAADIERVCDESRGVRLTYLPNFNGSLAPGLLRAMADRQRAELGLGAA